jgi:hypothetical protein
MKRNTVFAAGLLFLAAAAAGQTRNSFQVGLGFTPGIPLGEFRENLGRNAWGGNLYFAYRLPRSAVSVGTSFGFLIYGWESRDEWLSPSIPEVTVDVDTINSIFLWNVFLRLQPPAGAIRPYIDVFLGLHHLSTDTTVHDHAGWDDDGDGFSSNNYRDTAFSYGAGTGLLLPLVGFFNSRTGDPLSRLDLDLGVRLSKGGRADYLVEGSLVRRRGDLSADVHRSETDLLTVAIGLVFTF